MRIGLAIWDMPAREVLELAMAADENGFDSIWVLEHLVLPASSETEHPTLAGTTRANVSQMMSLDTELADPTILLAAVAARTSRLRLSTAVYLALFRHPLLTARMAVTLHDLSEGRFDLGIGIGWLPEEFAAFGIPMRERGTRLDETLDILRGAWAGGRFDYSGRHFQTGPVQITPRRVEIPIIFGGNSEPALRRAARLGDAWNASGLPTLDDALRMRDRLHELRAQYGRTDPLRCHFRIGSPDAGPPDLETLDFEQFRREGLDDIVIWPRYVWKGPTLDERRASLRQAAQILDLESETNDTRHVSTMPTPPSAGATA